MKCSIIFFVLLIAVSNSGCHDPEQSQKKTFSEQEVAEIKELLAKENPSSYRIVVPTFRDKKVIGSETLGSLPVSEVERIASLKGVKFQDKGNLQAILDSSDGDKNGPGSHTSSASGGHDIVNRIQSIAAKIESSKYVLIH